MDARGGRASLKRKEGVVAAMHRVMPGIAVLLAVACVGRAGPQLAIVEVAAGLTRPLGIVAAPGDFGRMFIVQERVQQDNVTYGQVKILDLGAGQVLAEPFITVGPVTSYSAAGLLGMAFDPDYARNGYFYLYSCVPGGPLVQQNVVDRYTVTGDPNIADPATRERILTIDDPNEIHNGGCMQFGPDGYLYIATGDGGPGDDPENRAQNKDLLFGKILRIDVGGQDDFPDDPDQNYHCPADNPFVGVDGRDEIWAYGLRHPWRFSFDRVTGDMYIGDVGQGTWEELDYLAPGARGVNFGWRCMEGTDCTGKPGCTCDDVAFTGPILEFGHGAPDKACAITGGYVYRGCAIPSLDGTYFVTDFCNHRIWTMRWDGSGFTEQPADITDQIELPPANFRQLAAWGEDAAGELYLCNVQDGKIYKLISKDAPEADCNGNGASDACDILQGVSKDADGDGVPDECEAEPCYSDCDGNAILDLFDFLCYVNTFNAGLPSADCTEDGALDLFDFLCFVNGFNGGC